MWIPQRVNDLEPRRNVQKLHICIHTDTKVLLKAGTMAFIQTLKAASRAQVLAASKSSGDDTDEQLLPTSLAACRWYGFKAAAAASLCPPIVRMPQ